MPTPKKTREHYKRIRFHLANLQQALNDAHRDEVIAYKDFTAESPCQALNVCRERIETTTEKARAKAMHDEISKELNHLRGW